jgi:hypothetical protein
MGRIIAQRVGETIEVSESTFGPAEPAIASVPEGAETPVVS